MNQDLSPAEAAARIGATTRSVQRWIATGKLSAKRVGGRWRVASDAIDAFAHLPEVGGSPPRAIRTLFIANRGEIARRIRRTCDRLGIVAIVPETEGPNALDLLDAAVVVRTAVETGADALHPGFGFLAENADFAAAVEKAGIRWVGPSPAAIRAMGDKAIARRLAREIGVPVLPGYDDPDQTDATLAEAATAIGTPLLVKPAAGGGGKGMRIVRDLDRLKDAIDAARREARSAFGDERLILERYLDGPRHVEIQLLFDHEGNGVHLGERDCSIQRRHQKILEETPSPAVDADVRSDMGEAALALAHAVGYVGAGTCEFLLDDRGSFHFLEMNTRLQVEHPVTEMVTGRDIVADQIRIAAHEPLGLTQADVRSAGHAVEVRLYAEDAEAGFLPATGRVESVRWPNGEGVRVDEGIDVGTEIGSRFDPMLAKIVAHGADRRRALARLTRALDETVVLGLVTNLRFLRWLVRQPVVLAGEARIDTLERIWPPDDWEDRARPPDDAWAAAAARLAEEARRDDDPWSGGWRLNAPPSLRVATDGETRSVRVGPGTAGVESVLVGDTVHVDVTGRSVPFRLALPPDVDRAARLAAAHAAGAGPADLVAPMPGAILAVHIEPGQSVAAGDPLITIEAMKMEHVVVAPIGGRLVDLAVRPQDQVTRGQILGSVDP